jgi:hypothetical protein
LRLLKQRCQGLVNIHKWLNLKQVRYVGILDEVEYCILLYMDRADRWSSGKMFLCYFIFVNVPPTYKFCKFTTPAAALNMTDDDHAKRKLTERINMLPDEFRGPFWHSFGHLIALCNLDDAECLL